jgi:hypothetical protein
MTATERSARRRARARAQGPKAKPFTSSAEIYEALVEQRNLTSAFDRALAMEVVDALVRGDLAEAVRALALLPAPAVRVETSRTPSAAQARAKLLELVLNAKAADKIEADQADQSDLQAALARVAALEDEVLHLRGVRPRRLPPPSETPIAKKSDAGATTTVKKSGAAPTKLAADPVKPPPGYDPIVNGLWQPPTAATARPVSPPPSSSPPLQSWDESPGGVAWNTWRNSGG